MSVYLIVNADDCGYSPGINRGIIQAFRRGIVTSTTLMVNQPYCREAVKLLQRYKGPAAGLHLNLTRGRPVSDVCSVPSLVDAGGVFQEPPVLYRREIIYAEVLMEVEAQYEKAKELGIVPTHLDAHHHLQCHPVVRKAMIMLASKHRLPLRHFGEEDKKEILEAGIATPALFVSDFWDTRATVSYLCNLLKSISEHFCGECVEIMTHPGFSDSNVAESTYSTQREQELRTLCSPEIKKMITELKIKLVDYNYLKL